MQKFEEDTCCKKGPYRATWMWRTRAFAHDKAELSISVLTENIYIRLFAPAHEQFHIASLCSQQVCEELPSTAAHPTATMSRISNSITGSS